MTARESVGLALVLAGVVVAPLAYWLGRGWLSVAVLLVGVGGLLLFISRRSRRLARRLARPNDEGAPLPVVGDARGFAGHRVFDRACDGDASDD
jgi:hypothetical protein